MIFPLSTKKLSISKGQSEYAVNRIGIFLGASPSSGGMFQYSQSLVEALLSLRHQNLEVTVVYCDGDWAAVLKKIGTNGIKLRYSNVGLKIANSFMAMRIPGGICRILGLFFNPLVSELRSKNCNTWVFPAQDALTWQVFGVKVIGTIHDLMHRYESRFPEVGSRLRYGIREHRFFNIASHCNAVLVDSNVGMNQVLESYSINLGKVHVLPYIAPRCLQERGSESDLLSRHQLPKKFLFYPAQFWLHKNHYRLIDSIDILSKKHPDICLVLSGSFKNEYKNILKYVEKKNLKDKIIFLGYVPDFELSELYIRARALIYPTFFGPTNIPPLEAMMLSCPVVVSNIYAMPEQCGSAALYFDPLDAFEMARSISKVWDDDELIVKMIKKGQQIAAKKTQAEFNIQFKEIIFRSACI